MLKKTITYTDYDGNERTETFYFNLSQVEITEMEISEAGGLANRINLLIEQQDQKNIIDIFKEIIFKAYGEKSPDGKRFIKSEELSRAFSQTEAYNILFIEIATDPDAAAAFMNGIVPQKLIQSK